MRGKKTPTLQWNHTYFDLTNIVICAILRKNNQRKNYAYIHFKNELQSGFYAHVCVWKGFAVFIFGIVSKLFFITVTNR